jgi:hypothetical protein
MRCSAEKGPMIFKSMYIFSELLTRVDIIYKISSPGMPILKR